MPPGPVLGGRVIPGLLMLRAFLLSCLLALPAAADCVTAADLAKGIAFTRQDGHKGRITSQGAALLVEYVIDRQAWTDARVTRLGIYEQHFALWLSDDVIVGGDPPEFDWVFSPPPPAPRPGMSWLTNIWQTETDIGYGSQMVKIISHKNSGIEASFRYKSLSTAKLSGCTYRVQPVEATFKGLNSSFTRRWIYFPDIGFGLETRRDGVKNGLIALVAE